MVAGAGADAGRQEADTRAAVLRLFAGEAGVVMMTDTPRRVEREGQTRAGLAHGLPELAAGVHSAITYLERRLDKLRPVAFAIAYWMLGSLSEAEDVVALNLAGE